MKSYVQCGEVSVIVDALASPRNSGGMRLHADEVIRTWREKFPRDRLVVVGPRWVREQFGSDPAIRIICWPNDWFATRILGELVLVPLVAWWFRSYALLSLSAVVSPLAPRTRTFSYSFDWRHLRNPHRFSRAQLIYRRTWCGSLSRSLRIFAISQKTVDEIRTMAPSAPTVLVPCGGDHPRRWPKPEPDSGCGQTLRLVTYGHHNHKRPELAIAALAKLAEPAELAVLGATGQYREQLKQLAADLGVSDRCAFPGFVSENEYRHRVANSDAVLLLCDDDGFGLPVVEAHYFGRAAIVTADSGLHGIHPTAIAAEPTPDGVAAAISQVRDQVRSVRAAGSVWTWADTVAAVRDEIQCAG